MTLNRPYREDDNDLAMLLIPLKAADGVTDAGSVPLGRAHADVIHAAGYRKGPTVQEAVAAWNNSAALFDFQPSWRSNEANQKALEFAKFMGEWLLKQAEAPAPDPAASARIIEALDRLAQAVLDVTAEDAHEAVYEDHMLVRNAVMGLLPGGN